MLPQLDSVSVRKDRAQVVEEDDAVAEHAPALFEVGRDDVRRRCIRYRRARAGLRVLAHVDRLRDWVIRTR